MILLTIGDDVWSFAGLFFSAFISATLAPGGSEALLGYLVMQSAESVNLLVAVATVGNTLGAVTTWLLGYFAAARFPVETWAAEPRRQKALAAVRRHGAPLLLLSWLPVVGDGFCLAAGWLRLPFPGCLLAMAAGKLARYAVIAYALIP